jgi:hypothetical protein
MCQLSGACGVGDAGSAEADHAPLTANAQASLQPLARGAFDPLAQPLPLPLPSRGHAGKA